MATSEIAFLLDLLDRSETSLWSGRIADLQNESLITATWHTLAQKGLQILEYVYRDI